MINKILQEYCNENNLSLNDSYIIVSKIKNTIEEYFSKDVAFDGGNFRFLETNKKITIGQQIEKKIKYELASFINSNIADSTIAQEMKIIGSIVSCIVIKETEHGYFAIFNGNINGYISKNSVKNTFKRGEKYFMCAKRLLSRNGIKSYTLIENNRSAQHVMNIIFKERYLIEKYRPGVFLSFKYNHKDKPKKEDLIKIRDYFHKEKIIFNSL